MSKYDANGLFGFDREVLEDKLENQLITKLDMNQFITTDYSLAENAGMKKVIHKYVGTGSVEELSMGEGNTGVIGAGFTSEEYEVGTTQGKVVYYDEQFMNDPVVVDKAVEHLAEEMTNDITSKVVAELSKASRVKYGCTFSYANIVEAKAMFPDEQNEGVFMLVSTKDVPKIMITLEASLKYVEGYIRSDYIGSIAGMPIYATNALPEGKAFMATREAVTCFMKKGVAIETERDADTRKNLVFGRNVKIVALTNDKKVVMLSAGSAPSTTVTVETLNEGANASISGQRCEVSGQSVVPGVPASFAETFPLPLNNGVVVQLKNIIPSGGATIEQENPALKAYYDNGDQNISKVGNKYFKKKNYDGSDANYELIVEAGKAANVKVNGINYQVVGKFQLAD